jgi:Uncharacterised protein family (UPF0236)
MSRRRTMKRVASTVAPNDGTKWGHLSDAELLKEAARELARRQAARGVLDLNAIESLIGGEQRDFGEDALAATIEALPPEDGTSKPCPKCGALVPVKARNRVRHIMTTAGELRVSRNYHHCKKCEHGFYPRDAELKFPEEGEVSDAMEKRILDFSMNGPFEQCAERWDIHYPFPISSNLFRRVVDRVARRRENAHSPLALQQAALPSPEHPPRWLIVAADGSMLLTREDGWREAKVATVVRGENVIPDKAIVAPRYVAVLGNQDEFRTAVKAALDAEHADDVMRIVWLGDGARENWTLAKELCPFAIQILDFIHAVQNAMVCGKALLGESDPCLPLWEERIRQLIDSDSPDAAIRELMDCAVDATNEQLAALDQLVGYYRANDKRMRYREFRDGGLPIGSGIVESAHKHVLQTRMKQAGQRWSVLRGRRMVQLRALYRTAGPRRFHWAIREALNSLPARPHQTLANGPRRAKHRYTPSRNSPINRANASK